MKYYLKVPQFCRIINIEYNFVVFYLCHPYGMMACPGATFLEHYDAAVILREYNIYTSVIAC